MAISACATSCLRENPAAAKFIAQRFATARRRGLWHPLRNSVDGDLATLIAEAEALGDRGMNAFARRGACPALSAPMLTGDGLLVRLNPVAGGLSPKALIGLCNSTRVHGNGVVEVTARGSLQLRGLALRSAALLASEVDALDIAVRTGVSVETGRLAGLDPDEIADPTPLADHVRAGIEAGGLQERLGPKVSVVVDGGGHSGMDRVAADIRLTAVPLGAKGVWQVAVAGDAETATPLRLSPTSEACDITIALLSAVAAKGIEGRARDVTAHEQQRILAALPPSGPSSPCRDEGRAATSACDVLPLTDGRCALFIALPFGHTSAERLIEFVTKAETLGATDIRLAPKRTILVLCPDSGAASALRGAAVRLGFVVSSSDPHAAISACPGCPACASGHIPARDLAAEIAAAARDVLDGSFDLHVSGCAKGCAHPSQAGLTLVGSENGAGIVVDGTARSDPLAYTASGDAAPAFARVVALIRAERHRHESVAACLSRLGKGRIAAEYGKK